MHQFDLWYMPSDSLYGNKYKYIMARIDAASRFKVTRPLRTKQAKDVAEMIADRHLPILRYFSAIMVASSKQR